MAGSDGLKNEFIQPFVSMDIVDDPDYKTVYPFKVANPLQCVQINPLGMTKPGLTGWVMRFYIQYRYISQLRVHRFIKQHFSPGTKISS